MAAAAEAFFFYGTLLFPEVRLVVLGRLVETEPAVLEGYERLAVIGRPYPGVKEEPGRMVSGALAIGLDALDVAALDAFEDAFYERRSVRVLLPSGSWVSAQTYVVPRHEERVLGACTWDVEEFRATELATFLRSLRR